MKHFFSLLLLTLLLATNTNAQAPTVQAVPANRVTYYGANLNVLVNPSNDSTTISFEYGLSTAYGSIASVSGKFTGGTTLFKTVTITGLKPGKTYHYRAKAINSSGTTYGSDRVFATGSSFSKSSFGNHTITVGDDGIVYAFGYNNSGQLGDNTTTNRTTPISVLKGAYSGTKYLGDNSNNPIISVVAGFYHSIALAADGSVYAFGKNSLGQLGDNTNTDRAIPIQVLKGAYSGTTYLGDNANNPIISVAASASHSIAHAADGSVYAFGYNGYGQLGDNTYAGRKTPIQVLKGAYSGTTYLGDNANNPIISVATSMFHNTALAADGSVYAFGYNAYGQLGDNTTTQRATPIQVLKGAYSGTNYLGDNSNNLIISVAAGEYHSTALAADGSVYAFGWNYFGQLGDNTTTDKITPIHVLKGAYSGTTYLGDNTNNPIISIMAGNDHNIVISADGSVYGFGSNSYGQMGDNTTTDRNTPIQVLKGVYSGTAYLGDNSNNPIISVAVGRSHSIALVADGSVYAFGWNVTGQLGDSTTTDRATPIQVLGVGATGFIDLIDPCKGTIAHVGKGSAICNGNSTSIGATAINGNTYAWTSSPAGYTSTAANPTVNPTTTTKYYLTETITATGCSKTDSVTITVNPLPTASVGSASAICNGSSANIGATAINGNTYAWTSSPSGFTSSSANPTVNPTVTTIYYLIETTTATGCSKTDSVTITVNPQPTANAGSASTICNGSSASIGATSINGNTYDWTSSPAGFTSTAANPTVSPTATTIYYLTETITATGCSKTDSVTITVNPLPTASAGSASTICNGSSANVGATAINGNTYAWTSNPAGYTSTVANPTVSPTATTIYYLTETTTATGCSKTDSVTITVNPQPTANAGSASTICNGISASIGATAISGNTYSWTSSPAGYTSSVANPAVNPITTTKYYLKETITATSCSKIDSVTITVNPLPGIATTLSGTTIIATQTSATYQWLDCKTSFSAINGATNQSYTATANGNYAVAVMLNGCSDTSACVTISSIGISDITHSELEGLIIYPNPTKGLLTLSFTQPGSNMHIQLMNSLGQIVYSDNLSNQSSKQIDMSAYTAGMYYITHHTAEGIKTYKIIKSN